MSKIKKPSDREQYSLRTKVEIKKYLKLKSKESGKSLNEYINNLIYKRIKL